MSTTLDLVKKIKNDEKGATAIEYGLIAALISVVIITALVMNNQSLGNLYDDILTRVSDAINQARN